MSTDALQKGKSEFRGKIPHFSGRRYKKTGDPLVRRDRLRMHALRPEKKTNHKHDIPWGEKLKQRPQLSAGDNTRLRKIPVNFPGERRVPPAAKRGRKL